MSSISATTQSRSDQLIGEESVIEDVETEMSNDEMALQQDDDVEIVENSDVVNTPNETTQPSVVKNYPIQGEMERRAEERLLDERIRERYQKEVGDIFAKRSA